MNSSASTPSHVSGTPPPSPNPFPEIDDLIDYTLPPPVWTTAESNPDITTTPKPSLLHNEEHSRSAEALLGATVPDNTKRANMDALNSLASFCITHYRPHRSFLLRGDGMSQAVQETRCHIFPTEDGTHLPAGHTDWTDSQLKHVRFFLVEFVANHKNTRTGKDFAPLTLKTRILSTQRAFRMEWGYDIKLLSGPIFNCPKKGLFSALDNKVREQQSAGRHVVSHNVLSRDDLRKLYSSPSLSKETAKGFQTRLVFTIGILTAMRPSALATLSVKQFRKTKIREKTVWVVSGAVGSMSGASKTARGGWQAIGNKVPEIPVWNEDYEDGCINFYEDIDEYMTIRTNLEVGTDRFFLAINPKGVRRQQFFKKQHLGKNTFMAIVKTACMTEGIEGEGQKNWVTTHGLWGTLATLLFQNGHSDSSVALRTGHRDPKSLKSYQNLQGVEGIKQQRNLFGCEEETGKRLKVSDGKENGSMVQRGTERSRNPFVDVGNVTGGTVNVTVHYHVHGDLDK